MDNDMLAELDEVVRLAQKATPGPWESASRGRYYVGQQQDEASVHGADDADIDEVSNVAPLHAADTIRGDCYLPDADLIAAAVNFLRTHHAALADMAKRLEAAERELDVRRLELAHERAVRERLVQRLTSIHALLYPAPVEANGETYRFRPRLIDPHELMQELSDRIRDIPAAIDAAQEVEG